MSSKRLQIKPIDKKSMHQQRQTMNIRVKFVGYIPVLFSVTEQMLCAYSMYSITYLLIINTKNI